MGNDVMRVAKTITAHSTVFSSARLYSADLPDLLRAAADFIEEVQLRDRFASLRVVVCSGENTWAVKVIEEVSD